MDYIQKAGKNYYFHKIVTKIRCAVINLESSTKSVEDTRDLCGVRNEKMAGLMLIQPLLKTSECRSVQNRLLSFCALKRTKIGIFI